MHARITMQVDSKITPMTLPTIAVGKDCLESLTGPLEEEEVEWCGTGECFPGVEKRIIKEQVIDGVILLMRGVARSQS